MAKILKLLNGVPRMTEVSTSGDPTFDITLVNNQTTPADITGALVDKDVNKVFVAEYGVVRWHSGSKSLEQGSFSGMYDPILEEWILSGATYSGSSSGVDFYITTLGQLQYTTTNRSGTVVESALTISIKLL